METEDDGRIRTGTVWTATAHAVTAVVGSGVLALPWSVAQMGWILGPFVLVGFATITYFTATLLSDCYRTPDPVKGRRNYTYMDAVRACLGGRDVVAYGIIQYLLLWGVMVGYTITAAMSMMEKEQIVGQREASTSSSLGESRSLILSQFPSLEKVTLLSVVAAVMSFAYSFIALYLSLIKVISVNHGFRGTLTGVKVNSKTITLSTKLWNSFRALGNIAFAYTYAMLLIEIQDTLKSPPAENKTMKRATMYGIGITTLVYVSLGCVGYGAFGNDAPGNVLTGFHKPSWLVYIANLAVIIHLVGAYHV
ncbi:hypothetical protein H6P81_001495 [Aristolochia fimbriata]|uniref:Amino acid transporter transmembrane domain-containing protein n=1 Tax=Aristolochia fimbriata TaxID=158543 RepID=A0AAV7FAB3_ARIFI|nr:hypothetical protein H6P81_001495 [Aristolochia fimbriata]